MGEFADEDIDRILSWEYAEWGDYPAPLWPGIARPEPIRNAAAMFAPVSEGAGCANDTDGGDGNCGGKVCTIAGRCLHPL